MKETKSNMCNINQVAKVPNRFPFLDESKSSISATKRLHIRVGPKAHRFMPIKFRSKTMTECLKGLSIFKILSI